jgi:hypothetical protein
LVRRGVVADVFVVGGAAMALAYDAARVTRDVDAVFKPHGIVLEEARKVADDLGLPCWWLNEQASACISGKEDASKRRVFDHPGLRVMAASPAHVFAMKARAARTRDIDDLRLLAGIIGVDSAETACGYARTSTLTNPYRRDQPPCFRSFSLTTPRPPAPSSVTVQGLVQRSGQHHPRVRGRDPGVFQWVTSCGAAASVRVSPDPAALSATCSRRSRTADWTYKLGPTSKVRVAHGGGSFGRRAQASTSQEFQGHPNDPSCANCRERGL